MQSWLVKYRPTKSTEIIGDTAQIAEINAFLKIFKSPKFDPEQVKCANLLITGCNGIGKTLMVDILLQENGFEKVVVDLSKVSTATKGKRRRLDKDGQSGNQTINMLYRSLQHGRIMIQNTLSTAKKSAIVFDDVSNISNAKEKEAIRCIVKINSRNKQLPIIMIAGTKHNKTVTELKKMVTYSLKHVDANGKKVNCKHVNEIILKAPTIWSLEAFIKKICAAESLQLVNSPGSMSNIYTEIIDHSQYDMRRLVNLLEKLHDIYGTDPITMENFLEFQTTSKVKDLDPGIFEATRCLLNQYDGIERSLALYGDERTTIPLMIHENYPNNISTQYPKLDQKHKIDLLYNISKAISESDRIDGLIYSNQCWNLQYIHGFYSCVIPSFYINQNPNKGCRREELRFTQDYNKTSIKQINNKVIKKTQENDLLKRLSTCDFLRLVAILKALTDKKDLKTIAKIMAPYNMSLKDVEGIVKIDKIKKKKNFLTGKQKTMLEKLLAENSH